MVELQRAPFKDQIVIHSLHYSIRELSMPIKKILIPPAKKVIVTNIGSSDIKIWESDSIDPYNILKAEDSDQIFNNSDKKDLEVRIENYEQSSVEIVDFNNC